MIALARGEARLELLPEIGGAIGRFTFDGRDVLRCAPAQTRDVLETACFPLVPFANRIAQGRFVWEGQLVTLAPNAGFAHPLHGHGWRGRWEVRASAADGATLGFRHEAGDWPWTYSAEQSFSLRDDGLHVTLSVRNEGCTAMPLSLGFHPYFPRFPGTHLRTQVGGVWLSDAEWIPTERAGPARVLDLATGAALDRAGFVDHCHTDWRGALIIDQPEQGLSLALTASDALGFLHIYAPPGESFFCAEPVSAMPDAFNRTDPSHESGVRSLAPDAMLIAAMAIAIRRSPER